MSEHLPALQVVVPLLAAPVCFVLRSATIARSVCLAATWASLGIAWTLLRQVLETGPISYALGGWPPPLGIEYRVTVAGAFLLVVVSAVASLVLLYDRGSEQQRLPASRHYLYYSTFLLCLAGLLGIPITGDLFNVFVFVEISSLATYALIALGRSRRALLAAYSYLIVGTIGATFFLIGIGMLYQMTGTLNIEDLRARLPEVLDTRTILIGFSFLVVGTAIKLAVFPLHQWLPNAYSYAPAKVSSFLAGTATKVSYYLMLRLIFSIFGVGFVFATHRFDLILMPLSLAAMLIGAIAACYQDDLRRLLAYSSISQVGYMTLAICLANTQGLAGGIVHTMNHGFTKSALFLVVATFAQKTGSSSVASVAGLGRVMPLQGIAFLIGGMSLIGVPGTAGFVSKWFLVLGALERGQVWVAAAMLLSSLIAVVYVWRVIERLYFGEPAGDTRTAGAGAAPQTVASSGLWRTTPVVLLIGLVILLGIWTEPSADVALAAAAELLEESP